MNISIVVPIFNEQEVFAPFLERLIDVASRLNARIVVVDDGSSPPLLKARNSKFQIPDSKNVIFLRHEVNCGVGAAVMTGMEYAKSCDADLVLTIDGDGQHDPEDLVSLAEVLKFAEVDIVNGSRFLKKQPIPFLRRLANGIANVITFLLSGFWVTDSQSGMKGFSKKALEVMEFSSAGYEWCTDVFREANWADLSVREVPISVLYNLYSMRKGQGFAVGLDMLARLLVKSLMK